MFVAEMFPVGAYQCNCSLLFSDLGDRVFVVDPGDEFDRIWDRLAERNCRVDGIWHTHAHIDHVGATLPLLEAATVINKALGAPPPTVYLHPGDAWLYENIKTQSQFLGVPPFEVPSVYEPITDAQRYASWDELRAIHTPGHTPGSCCLRVKAPVDLNCPKSLDGGLRGEAKQMLFSGDTLFRRSIGRTDLWGGDGALIIKSIESKLLTLDDATWVVPGHGPVTTIGEEREKNPFLRD